MIFVSATSCIISFMAASCSRQSAMHLRKRSLSSENVVEAYKNEIRKVYNKERERSKAALVQACWRALSKEPPKSLLARIVGEKPTMEEAKAYAEDKIDNVLPTIDEVCEGMSVSLVIKDVTWETLNNGEFVEWLKQKYKHAKELREPFESYTAARGRTIPPPVASKQRS